MLLNLKNIFKTKKLENIIFEIGIFLLISVPAISSIFLLISTITGSLGRNDSYLKDKWNYPFLAALCFIILNCLKIYFLDDINYLNYTDRSSAILSSFNWIPFFYIFWAFKKFLRTKEQRKRCANLLIYGSIPFIMGGILQVFFNLHGPYSLFNGMILWFQREGKTFTSVFSNPNYAAMWLSLMLPFSFAGLLTSNKIDFRKIMFFSITALLIVSTILTYSRNGFISILITSTYFLNFFPKIVLMPTLLTLVFIVILGLIFSENLQDFLSERIFQKFDLPKIENLDEILRVKIFKTALMFISQRPIIGWGATTFPLMFKLSQGISIQHTHNIFIEVAYNYGIFTSLLIFGTAIILIYQSSFKRISNANYYEKAWKLSAIIFLLNSQFDVTYYDIRISILFWTILTGISCINSEDNNEKVINHFETLPAKP